MEEINKIRAETLTTEQLGELLQIGTANAQKIMREIKSMSDTLRISGVVHIQDYQYWLSARLGNKQAHKQN